MKAYPIPVMEICDGHPQAEYKFFSDISEEEIIMPLKSLKLSKSTDEILKAFVVSTALDMAFARHNRFEKKIH
jgi:hypothetical protein